MIDLLAVLNGAIGGLVSITAAPDIVDHYWAVIIGAVGGVVVIGGIKLLEICKVDDVVGAVPAHLFAGIWGTIAVCIAAGGNLGAQLAGIVAVGVFVMTLSAIIWAGPEENAGRANLDRGSNPSARMPRNWESRPIRSSC